MANLPVSRRGLLAFGGTALIGAGAGSVITKSADDKHHAATPETTVSDTVEFFGAHQAGIATPAQQRLAFAAYDLTVSGTVQENVEALKELLQAWTSAAAAMCAGQAVPGESDNPIAPPSDTGEAYGLAAANLTITVGFGPSLFDKRFGLTGRRPAALADLPRFAREDLDPERTGGDLCVQACADDPIVAFHAIRNLARVARGTAVMRWSQLGFGKATSNGAGQATPRNLMGFKDGTRNIDASDTALMDQHVWVGADTDQTWMKGGSYLVSRRIRMRIEAWDRDFLSDQEAVFGRSKYTGAPLTGAKEFDAPNFNQTRTGGTPVIPLNAHIRLASPEGNNGTRILRRGYSFTDGMLTDSGELDAGLFFIAYQRDPRTQFVPLQRGLSNHDALNEYISHVGSGLFACPPAVRDGTDYFGSALLEA